MTSSRIYVNKYNHVAERAKYLCQLLSEKWVDPIDATWFDAESMDFISKHIEKAITELSD